jgi:hypothetical protein
MVLAEASRMPATASPRHVRRCLTVDIQSNDTLMAPTSEGEMPKTAVILQSRPGIVNEIGSIVDHGRVGSWSFLLSSRSSPLRLTLLG